MDSRALAGGPAISPRERVVSGAVPPLADGFSARPETGPGLGSALGQATTVVLVPHRDGVDGSGDCLVVCGLHGFSTGALHHLRDSLDLRDAVEFPGWIPREDLHELYARAWAFLYPSRFEGVGLPVLEALAPGLPTARSASD